MKGDSEAVIRRNGTIKYSHDWSHYTDGFNYELDLRCEQSHRLGIWINLECGARLGLGFSELNANTGRPWMCMCVGDGVRSHTEWRLMIQYELSLVD